jgi:hypothetical protein
MIALVDPTDLENVLRPTVYQPHVIPSETRDLALGTADGEIPRFARDDIRKSRPDQTADSRRY